MNADELAHAVDFDAEALKGLFHRPGSDVDRLGARRFNDELREAFRREVGRIVAVVALFDELIRRAVVDRAVDDGKGTRGPEVVVGRHDVGAAHGRGRAVVRARGKIEEGHVGQRKDRTVLLRDRETRRARLEDALVLREVEIVSDEVVLKVQVGGADRRRDGKDGHDRGRERCKRRALPMTVVSMHR